MDLCEKMMIAADGKNLSAVLCGENGEMSTQQTVLMLHSRKEPVLHTIWGTEIGYISQLYELKTPKIYTKR